MKHKRMTLVFDLVGSPATITWELGADSMLVKFKSDEVVVKHEDNSRFFDIVIHLVHLTYRLYPHGVDAKEGYVRRGDEEGVWYATPFKEVGK